ncbi:putative lipoprotein YbaY [Spirosoma lacussanchae]|uniref:hypothetical protein n=1 Tax=Spirosoma lacussanchae TaxID=1884249 RepID=UPI001109924F|nr:hypothetical protein [Spirosoma lacussanchae]
MKTVVKSILLGLLLLGSFCGLIALTASAAEAKPTDDHLVKTAVRHRLYSSPSGEVINVNVEKPAGQLVRVFIADESGRVLAHQTIGKKGEIFRLRFNVADLEDGAYSVRISSKNTEDQYDFKLITPKAEKPVRSVSLN